MPALTNQPRSAGQQGTGFVNLGDYLNANQGVTGQVTPSVIDGGLVDLPGQVPLNGMFDKKTQPKKMVSQDMRDSLGQNVIDLNKQAEDIRLRGGEAIAPQSNTLGENVLNQAIFGQMPGLVESQAQRIEGMGSNISDYLAGLPDLPTPEAPKTAAPTTPYAGPFGTQANANMMAGAITGNPLLTPLLNKVGADSNPSLDFLKASNPLLNAILQTR